jgi:hypothetical protein
MLGLLPGARQLLAENGQTPRQHPWLGKAAAGDVLA